MVDLVEAARGDEFCYVSGRGVFRDLRQVQQQGGHQRSFGLRPERVTVVVLIEIEANDDGCDLMSQFGVSFARRHEVPAVGQSWVGQIETVDAPEMPRRVFE